MASKGTRGKDYYSSQYMKTEANLARKGKTNKKIHGRHANPRALKYDMGV